MKDTYIQSMFANRIGGAQFGKDTKIYKFEKIKRAKKAATIAHPGMEILDFGVGEPDAMADKSIREELKKQVDQPENRGYSDNGIPEFKEAAAKYLKKVYGVNVDPDTEINHCIGAKPGLAIMPLCFINPRDATLMTVPGYPVMGTHTTYLGGEVYNMPLTERNNFLPDLNSVPDEVLKRTKMMYLNYPNNPTGAVATVDFYKKVVAFAKRNNIVVVQDAPYARLVYNSEPLSFLSIPGAKDVGVEFHSMSKAFNMTGWRLGFVAGNALIVKAFALVKDNIDSGQFIAIQKAAIKGLEHPEITEDIVAKYKRRLTYMVKTLEKKGFNAKMSGGSFFLYVPIPKGIKSGRKFKNAEEFSDYLIREKLISTVPWDDAGHYFRMSATFVAKDAGDEKRVLKEFEKRLDEAEFEF
jgi:LL-diaminopimelate aminotransferase